MTIDFHRRRLIASAACAGSAALLTACDAGPFKGAFKGVFGTAPAQHFNGVDLTGAEYARGFTLVDHNGVTRSLTDFKGKVAVLFFGFTQCPDVCPTSLAELAQARQSLGKDGDRVQGLFVTVDPERDTPPLLKEYLAHFDPSFLALRGTLDETRSTAKEFKAYYAKVPGKTEGTYTMDHTAAFYVFDAAGKIRLFERHDLGPEPLAADLKQLLAASNG